MILALLISIFIMGLFILLHFSQHFRCRSCKEDVHRLFETKSFAKKLSLDRTSSIQQTLENITGQQHICRFNWCCGFKGDEDFDFFPSSFLLYIIFIMILSGLIILKYIYDDHQQTFLKELFFFNIFNNSNGFMRLTKLPIYSYLDWIIYFFIFISIIWESLFSFYRYYTTIISAKCFYSLNIMEVLKKFSIYIVMFMIIFIIETRCYYWCFPLVFIAYFIPNIYWILKVSHLLITSYKTLTQSFDADFESDSFQIDLIHSVKLMRYLSIISVALSTINITAFIVAYDMRITYYFPIIWSLSIACFACNFVRNRRYIIEKLCSQLLLFCKHQKHHKHPKHPKEAEYPKHHKNDASVPSTILELVSTPNTMPLPNLFKPTERTKTSDFDYIKNIGNGRNSLPVYLTNVDKQKLIIDTYISHSDPLVVVNQRKPEKNDKLQPLTRVMIETIETALSAPNNLHNVESDKNDNDKPVNRNKAHSFPTPLPKITKKKRLRKRKKNIALPLIDTDCHNITINTKHNNNQHTNTKSGTATISSKSRSAKKALSLLGLTTPTKQSSVSPVISPQSNVINPVSPENIEDDGSDDLDDGMIILYDEDDPIGMESVLPNLKLEVIDSNNILAPDNDPDLDIDAINKSYHFNHKKQITQTPVSAMDINQKNLMMDYFVTTSVETTVIDESMDLDEMEETTSKQLQLKSQFYHQTDPTAATATPSHKKVSVAEKPQAMSCLTLPASTTTIDKLGIMNKIRSSSNPLLFNFQRKVEKDSLSKPKATFFGKRYPSVHAKDDSQSVISVLNLFAAQGFCSKMSVNSVHQIQQLSSRKLSTE